MVIRNREEGFTLIELLTVVALIGILVTLGAFALRHFWLVRALEAGQDEVSSQLRRLQQRVVAETHPLVYGARFPKPGGGARSSTYGLVRFDGNDLSTPADDTCEEFQTIELPAGVRISPAAAASGQGTDFENDPVTTFCRGALGARAADDFVFFFARGNATQGQVTLRQTLLDGSRRRTICVSPTTGRVDPIEYGAACPELPEVSP